MAPHMPYGASHAFWRPICLYGTPYLPFVAHICLFGSPFAFMAPHSPFGTPHFLGSQKWLHPDRWNLCFGEHISGLSNDTPFFFLFFRQLFHWPAQFLIECHAALWPAHLWMPFPTRLQGFYDLYDTSMHLISYLTLPGMPSWSWYIPTDCAIKRFNCWPAHFLPKPLKAHSIPDPGIPDPEWLS